MTHWDHLFLGGHLATLQQDSDYGIIENAAIALKDDKIAWLGSEADLPKNTAQQVHHLNGQWITPGLIDCHTHLVYAGQRADELALRMAGKSYSEIAEGGGGIFSTVRATRAASEVELYQQSESRLLSMLQEGVTTIEIKSGYGLDKESELKMLRVARQLGERYPVTIKTTFLGAHMLAPEFTQLSEYIQWLCDELLPAAVEENLVDAVDAFCEKMAFSVNDVETLFKTAQRFKLPVKIHAEQLSNLGGSAMASRYQALSADHLEYLDEAGVKALADAGSVAVLLPGAFYFLKETQKPPLQLLRKHKVPIAVATDCNPGSSPTTSLVLMISMACTLLELTPAEALAGVTRHAARALGMQDSHGTLEIGKTADLAVWDIASPVELAYRFGHNPCVGIVKAGHIIQSNW